jgi:galactose PTS system EIIB component
MSTVQGSEVRKVVIACEAGMGSSVLLTTQLSQRLAPYGVSVTHGPVNRLADGAADVVLCHSGLSGRAKQAAPNTVILPFTMFMGDPAFDRLEGAIRDDQVLEG